MRNLFSFYVLFLFFEFSTNLKTNSKRKLISKEKIEKMCTDDIKIYEIDKEYSSLNEYINSLNIKEGNKRNFLLSLFLYKKSDSLNEFLADVLNYMFVISLSFVTLISKIKNKKKLYKISLDYNVCMLE